MNTLAVFGLDFFATAVVKPVRIVKLYYLNIVKLLLHS